MTYSAASEISDKCKARITAEASPLLFIRPSC